MLDKKFANINNVVHLTIGASFFNEQINYACLRSVVVLSSYGIVTT